MNLFEEIRQKFQTGNILVRLLIINCAVFVLALTLDITFTLIAFGADKLAFSSLNYPWNPLLLGLKPWSAVTALFTSWGLWHLLFNMICLYWLGGVFLRYYTSSHLRGLYILGGIAGMIGFTAVFLVVPSLQERDWTDSMPMCSACIISFCTALAFRAPDAAEPIPLIGPVKLKYIVIALVLIDLAILPHANPATDSAHLLAAATGWLFYSMLRKGHDITLPVTAIAVWLSSLTSNRK